MGNQMKRIRPLVCRETLKIIPRRINDESYFVIRAFDRQGAYPMRPGID
jgi:hypothetical protein